MRPALVLLDFDGLICDTERAARQSWVDLYARHGLTFPVSVWHRMVGRAAGERAAIDHLAHCLGRPVTPAELSWRRDRKRELANREPLRPGVSGLVDAAARRGVPVAVVSSSSLSWVDGHLTRLGMRSRLAFLVTGEDAVRHKPAPDLYLAALSRAGLPAGAALAVEDSASGVRAARRARIRCVAVPSCGCGACRRTHLGTADLVLDSLAQFDLDGWLTEQGGDFCAD